jgi:peptidoglycan hydrolase-like protein with peptidoglycan-binding domain
VPTGNEVRKILIDAETVLRKRKQDTTDKKEKQALTVQIQEWCCFNKANTNIDGEFGFGTTGAVQRFQRERGLPESGEVDERTWIELTLPMRRAIAPVTPKEGDTIYDVVLKIARRHLAEHPVEFIEKGEGNCGPLVRLYMNGEEGEEQPWCAGFVSFVVGQAAVALGIPMPIKRQVGVDQLVADAKKDRRLVRETDLPNAMAVRSKLRAGALFAVRDTPKAYAHTGIVSGVGDESFETIEGNTNQMGSSNGFEVCARSRPYKDKDFILLI